MQVLAHGGAGGVPAAPRRRQRILDAAVATACEAPTPVAAVVAAVRTLERSDAFNAGRGGTIQSDGVHRSDAGLMTADGATGAVCGLTDVATPIDVARFVMDETPHVLIGQPGAADIADHLGLGGADVGTDRVRSRFEREDMPPDPLAQLDQVRERFGASEAGPEDRDTVGAVARSGTDLAAATSTGGRFLAFRGRVGDVPQVGSGFYCSPAGAVSTTGAGEAIARTTLARLIERRLADGAHAQRATVDALATLERETGAGAGAITLGTDGSVGTGFTTDRMQTAFASDG